MSRPMERASPSSASERRGGGEGLLMRGDVSFLRAERQKQIPVGWLARFAPKRLLAGMSHICESRSDGVTVAVEFIPRWRERKRMRRGAMVENGAVQASLRDADDLVDLVPWDESHGYHRSIAPRWEEFAALRRQDRQWRWTSVQSPVRDDRE